MPNHIRIRLDITGTEKLICSRNDVIPIVKRIAHAFEFHVARGVRSEFRHCLHYERSVRNRLLPSTVGIRRRHTYVLRAVARHGERNIGSSLVECHAAVLKHFDYGVRDKLARDVRVDNAARHRIRSAGDPEVVRDGAVDESDVVGVDRVADRPVVKPPVVVRPHPVRIDGTTAVHGERRVAVRLRDVRQAIRRAKDDVLVGERGIAPVKAVYVVPCGFRRILAPSSAKRENRLVFVNGLFPGVRETKRHLGVEKREENGVRHPVADFAAGVYVFVRNSIIRFRPGGGGVAHGHAAGLSLARYLDKTFALSRLRGGNTYSKKTILVGFRHNATIGKVRAYRNLRVDFGQQLSAHGHDTVVLVADHRDDTVHHRGKIAATAYGALRIDVGQSVPTIARTAPAHENAHALDAIDVLAVSDRQDGVRLDAEPDRSAGAALGVDELLVLPLRRVVHAPGLREAEEIPQSHGNRLFQRAGRFQRPVHPHGHAGVVCDTPQKIPAFIGDRPVAFAAIFLRQNRPVIVAALRRVRVARPIDGTSVALLLRPLLHLEILYHRAQRRGYASAHRIVGRVKIVDIRPLRIVALIPVRQRATLLESRHHHHHLHVFVRHALRLVHREPTTFPSGSGKKAAPLRLLLLRPLFAHGSLLGGDLLGIAGGVRAGRGRRRKSAAGRILLVEIKKPEAPAHID